MDLTSTAECIYHPAPFQDADAPPRGVANLDPLRPDHPGDELLVTTSRRLRRLAIIACDTGARFARERLPNDPVAWMLASRTLFDGATALEACQERDAFMRATLLHGLSLGLDADPAELDALLDDGENEDIAGDDVEGEEIPNRVPSPSPTARLYTGTLEGRFGSGGRCVQAFCAMVATDEEVVRRRLRVRYGERLGGAAVISCGFDADGAVARSLLSTSVRRMLSAVALDPTGELGDGLDLQVEQRYAA